MASSYARRRAIPIAIALRDQFSSRFYRDSFVRMLRAWDVDCAHIASGFFTDFTTRLDGTAPDFAIDEEMEGKRVFLYGGYDEDSTKLSELRDAFIRRGVDAHVHRLPTSKSGEVPLRWHAKIAVFLSDSKPVLAIVGSSNFSGPTMQVNVMALFAGGRSHRAGVCRYRSDDSEGAIKECCATRRHIRHLYARSLLLSLRNQPCAETSILLLAA
ncbi:hypothetical protein [Burkholderia ubonensis]|uniref:hypothetical protein n=1 Tax=Burkholderia ubonensis TaxID=101571 RepID=UPI0012F771FE|nr:hypothetical protein [Burkholderia ubonensis]